jgi:hypothetical protein
MVGAPVEPTSGAPGFFKATVGAAAGAVGLSGTVGATLGAEGGAGGVGLSGAFGGAGAFGAAIPAGVGTDGAVIDLGAAGPSLGSGVALRVIRTVSLRRGICEVLVSGLPESETREVFSGTCEVFVVTREVCGGMGVGGPDGVSGVGVVGSCSLISYGIVNRDTPVLQFRFFPDFGADVKRF